MASDLTGDTTLVAVREQLTSEIEDEKVVLHTKTETYYGIEGIGARTWELLQQPRTLSELETQIREEYDVEPDRCRRDLEQFLTELIDEQLVERVTDDRV